ncbi:MAG: LegC family aminotransferase [Lentisphaerae bacterium]|nr:LegC family aminotransferase [Lentisphaerota bacterium]
MMNASRPTASREPGAIPGGDFIPLCVPEIRGHAWTYIKECLDTGWVSSVGSFVDRFEREIAAVAGTRHAVATTSGTAALHIALLVAGVQPDDEVLVSTLTFIAPANAIRYAGAWPVFIDADPEYWQMDVDKVRVFLREGCTLAAGELRNKVTGRRVRAILPVHVLGHPVDLDPILDLAREFHLAVIEDAAESLGTRYKGRAVGGLGDVGCLSFNGNKVITTGGGGMLVTNNTDWAKRARYLTTQAKDDPVEYEHHAVGYNYRLPNVLAALGVSQLEVLDAFVEAKRRIAATYVEGLRGVPGLTHMREAPWAFSTYWMYTVVIDPEPFGMDSRKLLAVLQENGIQSRPLWRPLHATRAHQGAERAACPVAEHLYRHALSLPCSVGATPAQLAKVIACIRAASAAGPAAV